MSLTKLEKDMGIIAALDDEPNDVGGLSSAQLKEKFDEAGQAVKEYINESLLPELTASSAAAALGAVLDGEETTVQDALDRLEQAVVESGNVPMGGNEGDVLCKASDGLYDLEWAPLFTAVSFSVGDWTASGEGYTLIVPQSRHLRRGANFGCILRHAVNGVLQSNTWAALGTATAYDAATGNIVLTAGEAYTGTALFCG